MSPHNPDAMPSVVSLRRYAGEYVAHAHGFAQVLVGLAGRLDLELDGRAAYVDTASALIVPAGVSHAYLAERPAQVLVIEASGSDALVRWRRFVPPASWRLQGGALDVAAALRDLAGAATVLPRRPLVLHRLDAAIDAELHGTWTTARMAALTHLSAQRFHPRFVELTGQTPGAYVRQRRLDRAQQLLRAGIGLEAAALHVGYASASALAYALRRERGVGARSLRRHS